jgi:hypothetical protein
MKAVSHPVLQKGEDNRFSAMHSEVKPAAPMLSKNVLPVPGN